MNPRYALVSARAGHRCEYCHAPEAIFNFPFEVEHCVPPRQGGSDSADNWALACRSCNLFKSNALDGTDSDRSSDRQSAPDELSDATFRPPAMAATGPLPLTYSCQRSAFSFQLSAFSL
ncbi:MAG: HNH endonuclease, partial [Planctomycetaceae bacterium]